MNVQLMNSNTNSNDFQYVQLQWLDELLRLSSLQINNTPELAQHKEEEHPELLQLDKFEDKYAKEKIRLTEGCESRTQDTFGRREIKNEPDLLLDIYDIDQEIDIHIPPEPDDVDYEKEKYIPQLNGNLSILSEIGCGSISKEGTPDSSVGHEMASTPENLRPLRIRRSYNCDQCGLLTNNPREYLYHLRSVHGEKIAVHECKYCIYASKHIQKLQRHCNLVHRQQLEKDAEFKRHLEIAKDRKVKQELDNMGMPSPHPSVNENFKNSGLSNKLPVKSKPQVSFFKCGICTYQTRNKTLMFHHEKTAHLKKKNFRCTECNYITSEKSRFTKHIKYHNLPKLQCNFCFFKTAYKWNMDRHMKNHEAGAEGNFRCSECNFTTSTKQSYNAHITNHHDPSAMQDDQDIAEANGGNDSNEWEDMNDDDDDDEEEEEEGDNFENSNGTYDDYEFSETSENPDPVWKSNKSYQRTLKCQQCDFRAAWPFELKKHEENHRSQKKHLCPMCGMRFEHIAWLIKHLRRIHGENPQAKSLANTFDVMKPARRRPGKEYAIDSVLPAFQDVLKQNNELHNSNSNNFGKNLDSNKSMLSTLLKKPLNPFAPPSVSKYSTNVKSKSFSASSAMFKQPRISNYYQKVSTQEVPETKPKSTVPTCNICNYKTRWISELQRHMRVHSQEKPFQCHKCKYVCKWKGDLNRHLLKYHGIKMQPGKKSDSPKFGIKKSNSNDSISDWQASGQEKRNFSSVRSSQESPLDLTLGRETFPHPNAITPYDAYDFDSQSAMDEDPDSIDVVGLNSSSPMPYHEYKTSIPQPEEQYDSNSVNSALKMNNMKYQCPRCPFNTTTVSKFHDHLVQHKNKRPFMCSVCGFNSNWEFDITKHIRLKGCRDKDHNKACVLLTDESGRRNYEKYEKYLVESNRTTPEYETASPEIHEAQENQTARYNVPKPNYNESSNKSCSYDFRNIGSNFEDGPVNIVVTPDIPLPDNPESQDEQTNYMNNETQNVENGSTNSSGTINSNEAKFFYCKHCDFKHSTKRVVVSHLSSHAGLKPYRCRACGIVSNWRHVIVRHVKDVHNGFMNVVEERINYVQEGFALRLISVSNDNDNNDNNDNNEETIPDPEKSSDQFYGCKICPYKCDKEFYMNFHMKQHRPREGAVFKCDYCPYFVKFKKTLVRHMKLHNSAPSSKVNTNTVVDIIDDQPQQLSNDIYMFNDNPENDQSNDQSNDDSIAISFTQLNQLDPSEASPQKIKRHICEHCPYKTDNKTQYLYHKQFHRPNPSAPFKCNICSYWATMQHLLTQHMRVHSESGEAEQSDSPKNGPKQFFEFFDDNKGVPEKISIVYVKKGEESVKMFKCEFCPMMNKKKANVRVHQKMHGVVINDGRYACSYCNYQCLNQGGLTNHMKVHQKNLDQELFNRYGLDQSSRKLFDSLEEENPVVRKRTSSYFCFKCPGIFKTAGDLENHQKFHGCSLPLKCTYCDYRAKHKPHITQHLAVHTAEYKAKRKAATPMNASPTNKLPLEETYEENKEIIQPKKIDQMLLLEASELKAALKKTGDAAANLHKCIFCPASFFKTTILVYHVSLHGSEGEYKCSVCDYAVSREDNLHIHSLVHPKKSPVKRNIKSFPCPKCPTVFYKQDRFERHQELHGKNYRFACDQCDYSVRFAANLIKHKKNHIQKEAELLDSSVNNENAYQTSPSQTPVAEYVLVPEVEEKRVTYICDRCPYYQMRKDAVQSHQRRHWLKDGYECPYCDYSSMQNSFLQSHIKLHMKPSNLFPPQAFMKFESFKIFIKDDSGERLLFDDESMVKVATEKESDETNETTEIRDNKEDIQEIKSETNEMVENITANTNQSLRADTNQLLAADTNQSQPEREDMQKLFNYIQDDSHTDSNLSGSSSRSNKVPIVVLNDIFRNDKDLKKWDTKLKIPKLKISTKYARSSSSERSSKKLKTSDSLQNSESSKSKKSSKPSLVVKIKVENRISKNEKTLYSVSKSSDERLSKDKENSLESAENTNDSTSDMIFQDSNPSLPAAVSISPVEDIEENTLTSNPDIDDRLRSADTSVTDMVDSIVGSTSDELILSRPSDENIDLKSDDSFSNDTVPAVSDILCDKLDCLTELSFKDSDLSLTNGDCSSHLTSTGLNLLPEEIKVGL